MMVATFKLRDLIPDTKDLLKWFWSLVWGAIRGVFLHHYFNAQEFKLYLKAGWRYRSVWKSPMGLYTHPTRGRFVVLPTLAKDSGADVWYWQTTQIWTRWSSVYLDTEPPEPPCESLRELEQNLMEWVQAREFYQDKNIPHKVGVLLHGPPGSGKTQFVKRITNLVRQGLKNGGGGARVLSSVVVDDEPFKIQTMIRPADRSVMISYPTTWGVAVWEDFDRYYHGDVGVKEDAPQFADVLRMLDERLGITFITVNDITKLDPAVAEVRPDGSISRPGRIDYVVYVGVADERGRRACASNLLAEWPELIDPTVAEGEGETIAQFQNRCKKLAVARYWEGRNEVVTKQLVVEVEPRISGETTCGVKGGLRFR